MRCAYTSVHKDKTGTDTINNIRFYLHSINRFKEVHIIERKTNYGLAKNIIEGVSDIIKTYGKVTVMEDDLVIAENFFDFMNDVLDFYQNEKI